jgi:membrane associated rhomboid family serine protease
MLRKTMPYRYYYVGFILIGINVFIFLITRLSPVVGNYLAMIPGLVLRNKFVWQPVTYMFVHANLWHLFVNMLGLFFFGVQVEKQLGSSEFLFFYLLTGTLAGVFSLFVYGVSGSMMVALVGASGAVYAVLLAFATLFPYARIYIFGVIPIRAPILVLVFTGIELFSQFLGRRRGVAHMTHLAGFFFAFLYFIIRQRINPIKVFFGSFRR